MLSRRKILDAAINLVNQAVPTSTEIYSVRRPLPTRPTQRDFSDWFTSAEQKVPPRQVDIDQLRSYMAVKFPKRWQRLQREVRWAEAELSRLGLIPEDVRWLL